ncbi:tetrahydrofolate synthase, partial [Streptococcus anginosus]|nr:tetrahydrofolate synthase [Streptococcus anginosus]
AKAKSGIIKYGTKATIIAPLQKKAAVNIIKEKCSQAQVPLILSDDIAKIKVHNRKINIIATDFTLESSFSLLGEYQRENLKTVIALVK